MTGQLTFTKKVDPVDNTIIDIQYNEKTIAWLLNDDYTNEQVDNILTLLNEQDKTIHQLTEENEALLKCTFKELALARMGDFRIERNDKGHYYIFSDNIIPKNSPIISIKAPQTFFNDYIATYIVQLIEKFNKWGLK